MAIIKNMPNQGLYVYAHDTAADAAKTGDAAQITATISLDGAAAVATNDTHPTEIGGGVYWFDLTQAETNAGALALLPVSSTADVVIDPVLVLTQEVALTTLATQDSVDTVDDIVDSILVNTTEIGVAGAGLTAIPWNASWDAEVQSEAADALNAYDPPTKAELDAAVLALQGADGDTLETLSDQLDDCETAINNITANATVAVSAAVAASVATGTLALRTYHSLRQAVTSTTTAALDTATKLWLAVKVADTDADTSSIIFIEATAGLTVLAGASYATPAHGSLTLTGSSGDWTVTVTLDEAATAQLGAYVGGSWPAEIKALVGANTVPYWEGRCDISAGIVRAYS